MALRSLPGVYVNINDLSQLPKGQLGLAVGYAVQADRGPVDELALVTSPTDFLTKFTLSGKPGLKDDKTFHSILKVLEQTNMMYVSRVANNPLYGGAIVKKQEVFGNLVLANRKGNEGATATNAKIVIEGSVNSITAGDKIMVAGTKERDNLLTVGSTGTSAVADGYFTVSSTSTIAKSSGATDPTTSTTGSVGQYYENTATHAVWVCTGISTSTTSTYTWVNTGKKSTDYAESTVPAYNTVVVLTSDIEKAFVSAASSTAKVKATPIIGIEDQMIVSTAVTTATGNTITFTSNTDLSDNIPVGCNIKLAGFATTSNNGIFKVESRSFANNTMTIVLTGGTITSGSNDGHIYYSGLKSVITEETEDGITITKSEYHFSGDDLFLITGINPGEYNGNIAFEIDSAADQEMVYANTMTLRVYDKTTGNQLESFTFSMDETATTIDGTPLYIEDVINGVSAYIKVEVNEGYVVSAATDLPSSTVDGAPVSASGGYKGDTITANDVVKALKLFRNKATSISILGNGCSELAESALVQQELLDIATTRKDLVVFLNSPKNKEKASVLSDRAQDIVDYKKGTLGSTSYYGCMYTPHVKVADVFNSKTVEIGTDAIAINGWLNVINSLNYPYAYAGPSKGGVTGVTCDWKIGDASGEATLLNDASINYIAFDPKAYGYYMQTQNTLQIANSTMRNLGAVFNVLDIKEHFETLLKQYLQLPITEDLRMTIKDTMNDYLAPMVGTRLRAYDLQETTTEQELMNGELHYLLACQITPYLQRVYLVMNIVNSMVTMSVLQSA